MEFFISQVREIDRRGRLDVDRLWGIESPEFAGIGERF